MITETVLEMHYHRPLIDLFRTTFGLGSTGTINFYKYSPQKECFIGFDQAYVKTQLSEEDFFEMLRDAATSSGYRLRDKFIGYFLQFKVVKEMQKRTRITPPGIRNVPYYRVTLDTKKNINTGLAQHELLYNLNQNNGAMVYYACPMIFDRSALYDIDIDLDTLRLADLASCPSSYMDNDNHFIYFNEMQAVPIWCSEPEEGIGITPLQLVTKVIDHLRHIEPDESALSLLQLLIDFEDVEHVLRSAIYTPISKILPLLADSLTVVKVGSLDEVHTEAEA